MFCSAAVNYPVSGVRTIKEITVHLKILPVQLKKNSNVSTKMNSVNHLLHNITPLNEVQRKNSATPFSFSIHR
jgi:hypothetical protein